MAELLLTQLAKKYDRPKPLLKPEDLKALSAHSFPGNARELRNVLERSLLKSDETARWLALDLNWLHRGSSSTAATLPPSTALASVAPPNDRQLSPIDAEEYRLIQQALAETNGGIRRAAVRLGLSPQALLRRLEKWPELRRS